MRIILNYSGKAKRYLPKLTNNEKPRFKTVYKSFVLEIIFLKREIYSTEQYSVLIR